MTAINNRLDDCLDEHLLSVHQGLLDLLIANHFNSHSHTNLSVLGLQHC